MLACGGCKGIPSPGKPLLIGGYECEACKALWSGLKVEVRMSSAHGSHTGVNMLLTLKCLEKHACFVFIQLRLPFCSNLHTSVACCSYQWVLNTFHCLLQLPTKCFLHTLPHHCSLLFHHPPWRLTINDAPLHPQWLSMIFTQPSSTVQ